MPQTRKTRGPRTAGERAHDAARSTATLFEKLPESALADEVLKPFATFLRFYTSPPGSAVTLREVRELEEAEHGFLDLMQNVGWAVEYMPVADGLKVERMVERAQCRLRDAKTQLAAQLATKGDDDA